jgi:hypothetical protein
MKTQWIRGRLVGDEVEVVCEAQALKSPRLGAPLQNILRDVIPEVTSQTASNITSFIIYKYISRWIYQGDQFGFNMST